MPFFPLLKGDTVLRKNWDTPHVQELFRDIYEQLGVGHAMLDLHAGTVELDQAAARWFGLPAFTRLEERSLLERIHPEDLPDLQDWIKNIGQPHSAPRNIRVCVSGHPERSLRIKTRHLRIDEEPYLVGVLLPDFG
jgi:PAS domain-containing protein